MALRAVQTSDFMTADWAELPYALLKKVSGRIINEVRGINRVTYDVFDKAAGDSRVGSEASVLAVPGLSEVIGNSAGKRFRTITKLHCARDPSPLLATS